MRNSLVFWVGIWFLWSGCQADRNAIVVAVAANLITPMRAIVAKYEAQYGQSVELVVASSGVLTAQIQNGAPFSIFLSADELYPDALFQAGISENPPRIFAAGRLVCWFREHAGEEDGTLIERFTHTQSIAIANPDLAPYGTAGRNWLQSEGLWEQVSDKIVYGENVGQVNQYIRSGAVDAALTASSAMYASELQEMGTWVSLEASSSEAIPHAGILLRPEDPKSRDFWEYVFSSEAQGMFADFGYVPASEDNS